MDAHESSDAVMDADESQDESQDDSPDYVPSPNDSGYSGYNTIKYNRVIKNIMACGVSNRDGAKIANGFYMDLVDLGMMQFDESLLLTETKIKNEKDRIGKVLIKEHEANVTGLESIGFDGKKSQTCKENCQVTIEDKITVGNNVSRDYVGSFIPGDGTGEECCDGVYEVSLLPYILTHHTIRNLHFLSENSTLISRENCRFF